MHDLDGSAVVSSTRARYWGIGLMAGALLLAGCAPTVRLEAPDKPIEINLNIKIEQEVRVKIENDVEELLSDAEELF